MQPAFSARWKVLRNQAVRTKDPEHLSGIIAALNKLCSQYEKSFVGSWHFRCYFDHGTSHHSCLFYHSESALLDFLTPYFAQGLKKGAYCFAAQPPGVREELLFRLRSLGVRVERALRNGSLEVFTLTDTYFRSGRFDPLGMLDTLARAADKARGSRFSGLRSAGDLSWAFRDRALWAQALHYETLLNQFVPGKTMTTVCHYDARLCSPMERAGLLNVHTSQFNLAA